MSKFKYDDVPFEGIRVCGSSIQGVVVAMSEEMLEKAVGLLKQEGVPVAQSYIAVPAFDIPRGCISTRYCPTCEVNLQSSCMCGTPICHKCGSSLNVNSIVGKPTWLHYKWGREPESVENSVA